MDRKYHYRDKNSAINSFDIQPSKMKPLLVERISNHGLRGHAKFRSEILTETLKNLEIKFLIISCDWKIFFVEQTDIFNSWQLFCFSFISKLVISQLISPIFFPLLCYIRLLFNLLLPDFRLKVVYLKFFW